MERPSAISGRAFRMSTPGGPRVITLYRDIETGEIGEIRRNERGELVFVPGRTQMPREVVDPERYRDVHTGRPAMRWR